MRAASRSRPILQRARWNSHPAFRPGHRASTLNDLERGNRLEVDWLTGRVVSLGAATGIPTPVSAAVYAVLKPHRMGKPA